MKSTLQKISRLKIMPNFLKQDYSPYRCKVSSNRENYGWRAKSIHFQNMVKSWINTGDNPFINPIECRHCLFDTRIPNIYIGPDGLCNMCMTYRQNFNRSILDQELDTFVRTRPVDGARCDAVVAFSGGKDSAISLYLSRTKLGLDVVAVLVDNGFIPKPVIDNGRAFCASLGVELVVLEIDFLPHLKTLMQDDFRSGYPCYSCTSMFHERIKEFCIEQRINRIILGRNWWRWLEPEVRSVRMVEDEKSGLKMQFLSLPFAMQLKEDWVRSTLHRIGWKPVSLHGNSTNCLIPGLVEYEIYQKIGYHPELNLLSREVITGYLDKEKARADLSNIRDLRHDLRRMVMEK